MPRDKHAKTKHGYRIAGFDSYNEYLGSELWQNIRSRIMVRDHNTCVGCGRTALVVHHFSYDPDVMMGLCDDLLVSLCRRCHKLGEFSSRGRKIRHKAANRRIYARIAETNPEQAKKIVATGRFVERKPRPERQPKRLVRHPDCA